MYKECHQHHHLLPIRSAATAAAAITLCFFTQLGNLVFGSAVAGKQTEEEEKKKVQLDRDAVWVTTSSGSSNQRNARSARSKQKKKAIDQLKKEEVGAWERQPEVAT